MSKFAFCGSVVFVIVLLLCKAVSGEEGQLPIQDHRAAIDIANQVSGFDKLANFSEIAITVRKVVVEKDDTSLYQWIEGRTFWKVSYSGVMLETGGEKNPYINTFDVLVDVETGRVPKISSQWAPGVGTEYKQTKARTLARKRKRSTRQDDREQTEGHGIPERYPQLSFFECLRTFRTFAESARKGIDKKERHRKHIVAIYKWAEVTRDGERVTVPVWYLTGFGGNTMPMSMIHRLSTQAIIHVGTDDTRLRKHMTIDAETGKVLQMGKGII